MNRCGFLPDRSLRRFGLRTGCCGRRLGFRAGISQEPAGQSAREPAGNAAAARSGRRQITGCARGRFFDGRLLRAGFVLDAGNRGGRNGRLAAVFCQRFSGKDDLFLSGMGLGGRRAVRSFRAAIVVTAGRHTAIVISAGLAALWRRIFRGRQIASAGAALRASTTMASATASPTAAIAATVAAAVSAAIIATIAAAAIVLTGTIVTAAGRIVLRGIVVWRKVLRRGSIGIRLAFVTGVSVLVFRRSGRNRVGVVFLLLFAFRGVRFLV